MKTPSDASDFQPEDGETAVYRLRLFVTGKEPNSLLARKNLEALCDEHLKGFCEVEVIDVLTDFETALAHNVVVTPTLVLSRGGRRKTFVGNLNDWQKILAALGRNGGDA